MDADFIQRLNTADRIAETWQVPALVMREEIRALGFKMGTRKNETLNPSFYCRLPDMDAHMRRDR